MESAGARAYKGSGAELFLWSRGRSLVGDQRFPLPPSPEIEDILNFNRKSACTFSALHLFLTIFSHSPLHRNVIHMIPIILQLIHRATENLQLCYVRYTI